MVFWQGCERPPPKFGAQPGDRRGFPKAVDTDTLRRSWLYPNISCAIEHIGFHLRVADAVQRLQGEPEPDVGSHA